MKRIPHERREYLSNLLSQLEEHRLHLKNRAKIINKRATSIRDIIRDRHKHPGSRNEFTRWLAEDIVLLLDCATAINEIVEQIAATIDTANRENL